MRAMVLRAPGPPGPTRLALEERPERELEPGDVLIRVDRCGVCRTDLHVVEGELPPRRAAIVPGHEVVGTVQRVGSGVREVAPGDRVGVPWLHATCGRCEYCATGRENLCAAKTFTGYSVDGGYAEQVIARAAYVLALPDGDPAELAPWLCSGIIGYRAFRMARPAPGGRIGFFGFGSSAHLALQVAARQGFRTVVYSRNPEHAALAHELGADDVVDTRASARAPRPPSLDGAVVFAPAGEVVLDALRAAKKGATVALAGIHMTPIPAIDYDTLLFGERKLVSVEANTRADAREFLDLARHLRLRSVVEVRPLVAANEALGDLAAGRINGAVVLDCTDLAR